MYPALKTFLFINSIDTSKVAPHLVDKKSIRFQFVKILRLPYYVRADKSSCNNTSASLKTHLEFLRGYVFMTFFIKTLEHIVGWQQWVAQPIKTKRMPNY